MSDHDPEKQFVQDSFWSLDEIMPKKRTVSPSSADTSTVLVESDAATPRCEAPSPIPLSRTAPSGAMHRLPPPEVYSPEHPLLRRVSVSPWPSRYTFYETFRNDALRYFEEKGNCDAQFVPFFSYMPQYVQMSAEQRAYYFRFRSELQNGRCLRVDSSYLFLYIYEILNLPDMISPVEGLRRMCFLWASYRAQYGILDRYLSEWICDYCLIHRLTIPEELLTPVLGCALHTSTFREFYLSEEHDSDALFASVLINFVSPYQFRTSKYYTDENAALFTRHTEGAVCAVIAHYRAAGKAFPHRGNFPAPAHIVRDSYSGSVCAYNIKKHIEIDYFDCSGGSELRILAADMIKCIENFLRSIIGVKSHFSIRALPIEMKDCIADYFAGYLPKKAPKANRKDTDAEPDYMKQYDSDSGNFSAASAYQIEQEAWGVTTRLTAAFEEATDTDDLQDEVTAVEKPSEEAPSDPPPKGDKVILPYLRTAAALLLKGDRAGFVALAFQHTLLPDTLAEQLNDIFCEVVGDIVLQDTGEGYTIIECYRKDLEDWIHA